MIKVPQQQIPGVYHRRVGDIVVTAISDGFLDGSLDVLRNIAPEEARQILADNFRPARRTAGQRLPGLFGRPPRPDRDRVGQLPAAHRRQGAGQHQGGRRRSRRHRGRAAHPHASRPLGGPRSTWTTGKRNYPNAELVVHENEPKHWFDDAKMAVATERAKKLYLPGRRASRRCPTRTAGACSSRARCSPASPPSRATATRRATPPS